MASKIKVDQLETADGSGTIALQNQLSGMTTASLPALGAAQMPTGSVLQVVQSALQDETETTSGSFVSTGLTATITPSSTSNKILVSYVAPGGSSHNNSSNGTFTIFRGTVSGTNLGGNDWGYGYSNDNGVHTGCELDSPNTTSAQTYTIGMRNDAGVSTGICRGSGTNANTARATLTLMEIKG
jgi:hypothetical protein